MIANTVVIAIVVLTMVLAVKSIIKNSKNGGCGCGCSGCKNASCPSSKENN